MASASGDASAVTSSTTKVSVTAADIGTEGNLSSGSKFTINGESTSIVIAKNDSSFAGGSRKDVQTVSKQDLEELKNSIIEKAKDYAKKQIEPKLPTGVKLITELSQFKIDKPDFSHELGEEASTISMKSPVTITHVDYKENDLSSHISEAFQKEKGSGFQLKPENIHYKIAKIDKGENGYVLQIESTVKLTQAVSESKLKNSLVGKDTKSLTELVKKDYKATGIEFTIHDPFPPFNNFTPFLTENITLKIAYQ